MSHMIDQSTGRDAIAFVGEAPWHQLGHQLTSGADIETWRREACLDYKVERTPVQFTLGAAVQQFPDRDVLYRDDTRRPLAVVSKWYNVVQPGAILDFFAKLTAHNCFTLETAGALDGGRRVWALARVGDGAPVLDADVIRPYVLLATSYDATLSTTAKFTSVRVVCHNTLTMSAGYGGAGQSENDVTGGCVRIPHSAKFDPDDVRLDLGIVFDQWERFLATTRKLARQKVTAKFTHEFLQSLLPEPTTTVAGKTPKPIEESKAYQSILTLFQGEAMGSGMPHVKEQPTGS